MSEHDPHWQEALVEVTEVVKGLAGQRKVVVVFASSKDVLWYKAPKFQVGQHGLFTLHKQQVAGVKLAAALTTPAPDNEVAGVYTAIDHRDFQPLDAIGEAAPAAARAERVKAAVQQLQKKP